MTMFVPIIMGSRSDLEHGQQIADKLSDFGIGSQIRVASAHKAVRFLLSILKEYESDPRAIVYITVAGRSNALSALVDANVCAPVIACPPYSDRYGGADIYSSLRLPSGVAPAVVLEPGGAALLAAKILSMCEPSLRKKVSTLQEANTDKIVSDDQGLTS